jgi:hypothetical protein
MRVSISVTLSKEIDPSDCSEIVANCTLGFDDGNASLPDSEGLQHLASCAIMACKQAIDEAPTRQPPKHDIRSGAVAAVNGNAHKRR